LFVNDGKGQAIVVAAGNDRNKAVHFQKVFSSFVQNSATVNFKIEKNQPGVLDQVVFDIWYASTSLSVTVVAPSGASKGPIATGATQQEWSTTEGRIYIDNSMDKTDVFNGDRKIRIDLTDTNTSTDNLATGTWKLVFSGKTGRFDGWLYESTDEPISKLTSEIDTTTLVTEPGNSKRVVTVSAYVSRNSWPSLQSDQTTDYRLVKGTICDFSSPGPPRSNSLHSNSVNKPELAAPGQYILSALSAQIETMPQDPWIASDGKHTVMSGTSMAAPHVTGLVALLFQANPGANVSDIRKILIDASPGIRLGTGWNKSFGYGIVDAYEAMKKLTPVDFESDPFPRAFRLYQNYPNPFNGSTAIECTVPPISKGDVPAELSIVDLNGKILRSFSLGSNAEGRVRIVWDGREQSGAVAPSGVYIYRFKSGRDVLSRKMVFIR